MNSLQIPSARERSAAVSAKPAAQPAGEGVTDGHVMLDGEPYLLISNVDRMPPFLMNVVSDSDFWLFVGSNTGFTAGRRNPDQAIFPYLTADKLLHQPQAGGVLSLLEVDGEIWEPWSTAGSGAVRRHLYKHATGCAVRFEEIHPALGLKFTWTLGTGRRFGLVRTCRLENTGNHARSIRLLDGWHQMLPPGVTQETYSRYSYLAAAYMRHELLADCGLGIYTLNSGITDRAAPCESLRANVAWAHGLPAGATLLSARQLGDFRGGLPVTTETEIRGEFGAHLVAAEFDLPAGASREWLLAADSGLDHAAIHRLRDALADRGTLAAAVRADLADGIRALRHRVAGADALQQTADRAASVHHFANSLFNCMRGGVFPENGGYERDDFRRYLAARHAGLARRHAGWIAELPPTGTLGDLSARAARLADPQLTRLVREYLPLTFSRRHGDPSRPWNRFEIHTADAAGRPVCGYSGNWRDIFQNWESLAHSYPERFEAMIAVFLNASTADGYNPYRITREGIDWEVHDPADPWSHIGYWGDHQIVYLLRLLEGMEKFQPGKLAGRLDERLHAYANVPYEIRGFEALVRDPRHSIDFNAPLHAALLERGRQLGGDGHLLADADGAVVLVPLLEKLLVPALAKLGNLIPGGGIWLNTQRPEWNDANNALAGWGLSVVTVQYLRRYLGFLDGLLGAAALAAVDLSAPVADFMERLAEILPGAAGPVDDAARWRLMAALGRAGEAHRREVYRREPFPSRRVALPAIRHFLRTARAAVDATLDAARRDDGMFHSYNLLEIRGESAAVRHLGTMLEGQVAALGSGRLDPPAAVELLRALRASELYRADQRSYLLYADRPVAPFLSRNVLPEDWAARAPVLTDGARGLISLDDAGRAHFAADLTNAHDLERELERLGKPAAEAAPVLELWEETFRHHAFTGRSGAMFAFEGLGSIYWHMVAKLLLAVQEIHLDQPHPALAAAYREIRGGLGFTKTAAEYGAFPTDPYSHTPGHRGAQQPGMTGQVKEEILTRFGELGVRVIGGRLHFAPTLLDRSEFFRVPHTFHHITVDGREEAWEMPAGTLAFTVFQVPVCYRLADLPLVTVEWEDGLSRSHPGSSLPRDESRQLFRRSGAIRRLTVHITDDRFPFA